MFYPLNNLVRYDPILQLLYYLALLHTVNGAVGRGQGARLEYLYSSLEHVHSRHRPRKPSVEVLLP